MRQDHLIILKKIPVDPKHVEALRLKHPSQKEEGSPHHPVWPQEKHSSTSPLPRSHPFFRLASILLFFSFLINPVAVAYADELDVISQPDVGSLQPEAASNTTTVVLPGEELPAEDTQTEISVEGSTTHEPESQEAAEEGVSNPPQEEPLFQENGSPFILSQDPPLTEALPSEEILSPETVVQEDEEIVQTPIPAISEVGEDSVPPPPQPPASESPQENIAPPQISDIHGATNTDEVTATTTQGIEEEVVPPQPPLPPAWDGGQVIIGTTTTIYLEGTSTATSTEEDEGNGEEEDLESEEVSEDPSYLDSRLSPEEIAAERLLAEAAMREQIRKEVQAEMRARCVSYGYDGYYCLDEESENTIVDRAPLERVTSEPGIGDSDKEIVIVRTRPEGESREYVTANATDDEFPSSDGEFHMIVWQTLLGGRWQIMYREGTGTPEYLTAGGEGNGHPTTDGQRIVWQVWRNNNWDIMIAEKNLQQTRVESTTTTSMESVHPAWTARLLSENPEHDMFPKIAGNFVTWQEHKGETWNVVLYDLSVGTRRVIESDAGSGEAPTVALLFRERAKDGRVRLRAKDITTGSDIPLSQEDFPRPPTLPIPEQQGALPVSSGTTTLSTRIEGEGDDPPPVP